ncbi:MAG: hypothetical protein JKY37_34205, partial [Nannocystaceae bacterium]|nr:hypothetical protein [Nannocystaceae bacterium]
MAVLASAALSVSCQPTHRGDSPDVAQRPFVAAAAGAVGEVLVFPPDPHSQPRGPSPTAVSGESTPADDIQYPSLNDDGAFSLSGRALLVSFRRPVAIPADPTGSLVIDPPVAGKTTWHSDWSVTFEADEHFDPEQRYALNIGPLTGKDGKPIGAEFTATFTARPELSIAG